MTFFKRVINRNDPLWDHFISRPPVDSDNEMAPALRSAGTGNVFPSKSTLPSPERLTQDLGELARFLGAHALAAIKTDASLPESEDAPFTIVCTVRAQYQPSESPGIGGQHAAREAASVNFSLAAYIRELGYQARVKEAPSDRIAASAGLGSVRPDGKFTSPGLGTKVYVGDVILTDVPLARGVSTG